MSNNSNMQMKYQIKYQIDNILQDYFDKLINKKQLYEYLKTYGYNNKQIKELIISTDKNKTDTNEVWSIDKGKWISLD